MQNKLNYCDRLINVQCKVKTISKLIFRLVFLNKNYSRGLTNNNLEILLNE